MLGQLIKQVPVFMLNSVGSWFNWSLRRGNQSPGAYLYGTMVLKKYFEFDLIEAVWSFF